MDDARGLLTWGGRTGPALQAVIALVRIVGYAVVGLLVFTGGPVATSTRVVQLVVYCVIGLGIVGWNLLDLRPALFPHRGRVEPLLLGTLTAAGGLGCTLPHGDPLVAFGVTAAATAGSEIGMVAGWSVLGTGVLAIEIGAALYGDGLGTLLGYPLLLVVGLLIGHNRRAFRIAAEQSAAVLAQAEELQAEQRRSEVLDERTRIAREIHDVLAHSLGALGIQIQVARAVLTDQQDIDRAVEILATAQRMAAEGLVETRRAVHALRTDALPLAREIARAAETHTRNHGAEIDLDIVGEPRTLPPDATLALLRIVQEALVNAAKHAPGRPVALRLESTAQLTRITVANALPEGGDTQPAAPAAGVGGGYGLIGMRERLRLLNGTLAAGPADGRWTVTAEFPHGDATSTAPNGRMTA
ncbi:sensor histidine kinase [Streptacidiphilus albus]|uniref:sensor histidine kinase n=1 Tax=Streptacidiphilus albus TaxID=105425 RepID=UPI00068D2EB7|nr:histidine kinase [Streptacidiphilus albus]